MKKELKDPDAPFGVDLLIPAVGGTARKTNVCFYLCMIIAPNTHASVYGFG